MGRQCTMILIHYSWTWERTSEHPEDEITFQTGNRESLLLGTGFIYFKARKLKEMSVAKYTKRENLTDALIFLSHWDTVEGRHMAQEEFDFPSSRYLWQFLVYADTFAESTIHDLDLTSVSGLGELSLKLNTLLEASGALHNRHIYFHNFNTLIRHSPLKILVGATLCLFSYD